MKSSQNAYQRIKKEKLKPKSRYNFIIKNYLFWFSAILSSIIGAMAVAIIIFFIRNQEWSLYFKYASFTQIIYFSLPYLWFFILIILIFLAYLNFKKTEFGYRYSFKKILVIYFATSIILGSLLHSLGFSQSLNNTFDQKLPFYKNIHQKCSWFWQNPQAGRLGGEIIDIKSDKHFILKDLKDKTWVIHDDNIKYSNKNTRIKGRKIRIIGNRLNQHEFKAQEIKPFIHEDMPHDLFRNNKHMPRSY